jgi:hypothetical protein
MIMTSNLQNQLSKTTLIVCQCTTFQINENKWIHNILYAVYKLLQCMLRFVCKTGHSSLLVICVFYLHFYFSYSNLLKTDWTVFSPTKYRLDGFFPTKYRLDGFFPTKYRLDSFQQIWIWKNCCNACYVLYVKLAILAFWSYAYFIYIFIFHIQICWKLSNLYFVGKNPSNLYFVGKKPSNLYFVGEKTVNPDRPTLDFFDMWQ